jgi:hypothetical protein
MDFRYFLAPPRCGTIRSKGPEPAVLEHFLSTEKGRQDSTVSSSRMRAELGSMFLSDKEN